MKTLSVVVATAILALSASAASYADGPVGYPGSTWGQLTAPSSVIKGTPEDNNWLYMGKITQGVDWLRFGKNDKWTFDTYGSFGFSVDRNRLDYNNKIVPAIGAKIERSFTRGVVSAGVEGIYERHFGDTAVYDSGSPIKQSGYGVQAYVSYWFGWNLK
jgi:hypothetical protein